MNKYLKIFSVYSVCIVVTASIGNSYGQTYEDPNNMVIDPDNIKLLEKKKITPVPAPVPAPIPVPIPLTVPVPIPVPEVTTIVPIAPAVAAPKEEPAVESPVTTTDTTKTTDKTDISNQDHIPDQKNNKYLYSDWSGSIMFDNSLLKSLNSAIDDFNSNKDQIKKNISSSETNNNDVKSILDLATQNNISPSFYLGSILYSSKDDWTIWVNSKKIIAKKKEDLKFIVPQLKLLDINEQYIIFSWQSRMLDNLSPNWKDKLIKDANSYHSKDNRIVITDSNILTFKLYPNQSFSIYDMEILEGFVPDHVEVKKSKMDDKTNE